MAEKTSIEWTDASWNPVRARNKATGKVGWHCVHVSEGCRNCYAEAINLRLGTGLPFKPGHEKDIEIFLQENILLAPLKWRAPLLIFLTSMSDFAGDFVTEHMLDQLFAIMALTTRHTYQALCKRPERMRRYLNNSEVQGRIVSVLNDQGPGWGLTDQQIVAACNRVYNQWPLSNIWIGTSVENQAAANERIPHLLATPAVKRFVSAEPLLGPIDLRSIAPRIDALKGEQPIVEGGLIEDFVFGAKIDWVIVGGESGREARPMHPDWPRDLRDQCKAAGVPFFFKQWGEWVPRAGTGWHHWIMADGSRHDETFDTRAHLNATLPMDSCGIERVGKNAAGNMLNGRQYLEFPA